MFTKILIANRGEIACRIIRTCRRLGIPTLAIHSAAEGGPLHAELADQAVLLPDSPNPIASYLDVAQHHIHSPRANAADAIHPGYGLLSENPDLADACAQSGLTFVGPPTDVIRLMGNKREARRRIADAGVPVLPGAELATDADDLESAAQSVGYPLMVKASEGGGGIGMQIVSDPRRLSRAVSRTRSSARRAFGSEDVYLERFIPDARHVEVQIAGDSKRPRLPPLGARMFRATPPPESHRRSSLALHIPGYPRPPHRHRRPRRPDRWLPKRRHLRVPAGPERRLLLHRGQHPPPG